MIIFLFGGILEGIKQAWHYVTSAVERGIKSVTSYERVKEAGLDVIKDSWVESWDLYEAAKEAWDKIRDLPEFYKISPEFSVATPFDWRQQHIMKMKIHAVDANTGEWVEQWITVESNTELSKAEWLMQADEAVTDSPFGYTYDIQYVSEYEYYQKGQ